MTEPTLPQDLDADALARVLADLSPRGAYERGVLDLLRLLGLVDGPPGELRASDEVAGLLLSSLRAHLADDVRVGLRWGDLDATGLRGVDVLRAVETARARRVASPTPARAVRVVQAVIKGERGGEDVYLMQYDRHAGRYQPLGGKQEPADASPEAALRREIMEELRLDRAPGPAALALEPLGPGWQTRELSATYGVLTVYEMAFFVARAVRFEVPLDADTRWLARGEIAHGQAADGRPVSPVLQRALGGLERLDALPAAASL